MRVDAEHLASWWARHRPRPPDAPVRHMFLQRKSSLALADGWYLDAGTAERESIFASLADINCAFSLGARDILSPMKRRRIGIMPWPKLLGWKAEVEAAIPRRERRRKRVKLKLLLRDISRVFSMRAGLVALERMYNCTSSTLRRVSSQRQHRAAAARAAQQRAESPPRGPALPLQGDVRTCSSS